jgi:para-nitrobenzyl esterase
MRGSIAFVIVPILLLLSINEGSSEPIVTTATGSFKGNNSNPNAFAFWKIPYAKPPVGDLRFSPPQAITDSDNTTFIDTSSPPLPGDACIQVGVDKRYNLPDPQLGSFGKEDCLTLDVYTSALGADGKLRDENALKPVMVWITGGGGVFGGSYYFAAGPDVDIEAPTYDARNLVASKDVVVVSLNYRMGALGGLGLHALQEEDPHGSTGNYAHQDVNMALKWVKENIAMFGGDANTTTIFGQSAGGRMTTWQLAMNISSGLFTRAIMQSPDSPGTNDAISIDDGESNFLNPITFFNKTNPAKVCCKNDHVSTETIDDKINCPNINTRDFVKCLRDLPAEVFATLIINGQPTIDNSPIGFGGKLLDIFASGSGNKVPTIFGTNRFESLAGSASNKSDLFPFALGTVGSLQHCAVSIPYDVHDDQFGRELITKCSAGNFKIGATATGVLADDDTWQKNTG